MMNNFTWLRRLLWLLFCLHLSITSGFFFPTSNHCQENKYRTIDGSCNNLLNPHWGMAGTPYTRFLPPDYGDGRKTPRVGSGGFPLPNTRSLSTTVAIDRPMEHPKMTHLFMLWGQFLNHEMTHRPVLKTPDAQDMDCCGKDFQHPECYPIQVISKDPHFGPLGVQCINMARSLPYRGPNQLTRWREHPNNSTAFIDGSVIYGSDKETARQIRSLIDGKLKITKNIGYDLLPQDSKNCEGRKCFKAGDSRVNMFPALASLHTLWLRQHNAIAGELKILNRHWDDETLYQETRKIVGAILQHITYNEYLTQLFPSSVLKAWKLDLEKNNAHYFGYDLAANPSIASVFATAAFRFGHSLVQPRFSRVSYAGKVMNSPLLSKEFDSSHPLYTKELDAIIRGMTIQHCRNPDQYFTNELTEHLFENKSLPGSGSDLFAINVQRGRDNGIASYTSWRKFCGLGPMTSFEDMRLVMPATVARELQQLYDSVDDVDLYPAGVAEFPVPGGSVGPTFTCLIARQFQYLRQGDRFWYENGNHPGTFTAGQLRSIRQMSLARVICDTTETIRSLQPQVFLSRSSSSAVSCSDTSQIPRLDLSPWKENHVTSKPSILTKSKQAFIHLFNNELHQSPSIATKSNISRSKNDWTPFTNGPFLPHHHMNPFSIYRWG